MDGRRGARRLEGGTATTLLAAVTDCLGGDRPARAETILSPDQAPGYPDDRRPGARRPGTLRAKIGRASPHTWTSRALANDAPAGGPPERAVSGQPRRPAVRTATTRSYLLTLAGLSE